MSEQQIDQVLIVGGGTAGWLTAAKLAKHLDCQAKNSVQVTLVESPDIPTIGVGEGTWPTMRKTLAELGNEESEFINYCHASLKQGTRFVNWKAAPQAGVENQYYHLFTSVSEAAEFNLAPYWLLGDKECSYAQAISAQYRLCELGLAPKNMLNKPYEGMQNYAYHLDAGKFAVLLKKFTIEKLGVKFLSANVSKVNLDAQGYIASVDTDIGQRLSADFFVDCSGFRSLLLGDALKVPFKSIQDTLLTDHAIAIQVPYDDDQQDIASCTMSTAQEAGWIWDIGLSNRRGTGYVYCSKFVDHATAEQTLRDYIGPAAQGLDARLIKMNCGYREKFCVKNCLAIGLSAAFVEPLEASAIFLIEASANMLCDLFPRHRDSLVNFETKFNQSFNFRWNKTIDFIKMHYFLSQRSEPFWLANKELSTVPDSLLTSLAQWKYHPISKYDFSNVFEPFPQESYQYVLYGMGFDQQLAYNASSFNQH
ncbi:MAG: tryptophan 7-halogenase, partial [Psychrobium sp.]|nr:tryptophan 7-halogenase [Psychrobium sp.]